MKTAIAFETKLVEYATVIREYDAAEAACKANGWKSKKLIDRLEEIEAKEAKLRGPLHTALGRLAREIA